VNVQELLACEYISWIA